MDLSRQTENKRSARNELKVAIVYGASEFEAHLKAGLGVSDFNVEWEGPPSELLNIDRSVNALIVNLDMPLVREIERVIDFIERFDGVVIFNEAPYASKLDGADFARWQRHLKAKLLGAISNNPLPPIMSGLAQQDNIAAHSDMDVWILGASIGGPEAVRAFLGSIYNDLPILFILVQHMGEEFLQVLVRQLDQESLFKAILAEDDMPIESGTVLVVPAGKRISIGQDNRVHLDALPEGTTYSPCIDLTMEDLAKRYGKRLNAIIFSGMANDSREGVKAVIKQKGQLWVQTPETCVVSTMVDGAKETGNVSYSGTPEELANHLQEHYSAKNND
ncbi:MAG: chemotaxis protein CheB [bacterium]